MASAFCTTLAAVRPAGAAAALQRASSPCRVRPTSSAPATRQTRTLRSIQTTSFVPAFPSRSFSSTPGCTPIRHTTKAAFDMAPLETAAAPTVVDWPKGAVMKLLYDGECPICVKEVDFLRSKDKENKILFEDIASPSYDPALNGNVSWDEAMDKIHAVLPDGSSIVGMEVFRRTYAAIGLGWIYAPTAWPGLRPVFDKVYDVWAANRLTLTGRPKCSKDGCELKL